MQFRIGDMVRRINKPYGDILVGDIKEIVSIDEMGGLGLKGDEVWVYSPKYFELVESEEKLPDIEKTVFYYDCEGDHLKVHLHTAGYLDLVSRYQGQTSFISFNHSKDVLDLAHDLLRMGLEMKRGGF